MEAYPVQLFIDREDMSVIHAQSGYMIGTGRSIDEAMEDLKRHLGPEGLKARLDKMGWYEGASSPPAAGKEPGPPSGRSSPPDQGAVAPHPSTDAK